MGKSPITLKTVAENIQSVESDTRISRLDFSMFSKSDLVNMILQRSEILFDINRPGRLIRQWASGENNAFDQVIEEKGDVIALRTIAIQYYDYLKMQPIFAESPPKSVADIGCGYGFYDLFIAQDFQSDLLLIDIEESENRGHGFREDGAAYTSLAKAEEFLVANGVSKERITLLNPNKEDLQQCQPVDLIQSYLSCGFHYPVETYLDFFQTKLHPKGRIVLDLRLNKANAQTDILAKIGETQHLIGHGAAHRVLVQASDK